MSLKHGSLFNSDTIGTKEKIALMPLDPATPTLATIATVFYGTSSSGTPQPVPLPTDRLSFELTVLAGINALIVVVVSPNPNDEDVQLCQGTTQIALLTVTQHSAKTAVLIQGN